MMSSTLPWMSSTLPWMSSTLPFVASEVAAGACAKPADEPRPSASKAAAIRTLKEHIGTSSIGDRDILERPRNRRVIVDLLHLGRRRLIFGIPNICAALGNLDPEGAVGGGRVRERRLLAVPQNEIFLAPGRNVVLVVPTAISEDRHFHRRITGVAKPHADREHAAVAFALHDLGDHARGAVDVLRFRQRGRCGLRGS